MLHYCVRYETRIAEKKVYRLNVGHLGLQSMYLTMDSSILALQRLQALLLFVDTSSTSLQTNCGKGKFSSAVWSMTYPTRRKSIVTTRCTRYHILFFIAKKYHTLIQELKLYRKWRPEWRHAPEAQPGMDAFASGNSL